MAAKVERPRCGCHGVAMVAPGHWQCAVVKRRVNAKYNKSPKGRAGHKKAQRKWAKSLGGRLSRQAAQSKYANSPKGFTKIRLRQLTNQRAHYIDALQRLEKEITNAQ